MANVTSFPRLMTNAPLASEESEIQALRTRLVIVEAALECIHAECVVALEVPDVSFSTVCRVASVTRQALSESWAAKPRGRS